MDKGNMIKTGNRNHTLDVMKGLCILFIIVTHFEWQDVDRLRFGFAFWIDMAVPLFMIISGYAYSMSFENHGVDGFEVSFRLGYVLMKFVRYTVPFCVAVLIELGIIAVGSIFVPDVNWDGYRRGASVFKIIATGGLGPGSYYYPIMIQFILIFPFIYFLIRRYNSLGFVMCILANALYEIIQTGYGLNEETYRLLLFRYVMLIGFGVYVYLNKEKQINVVFLIMIGVVGIAYIIANKYCGWQPRFIPYWQDTSFLAVMYLVPIAYGILKRSIAFKPLELLGRASFEIFLTQMIYFTFGATFVNRMINSIAVRFALCMIIILFLGTIFYMVEYPITRRIAKAIGGKADEINMDSIMSKLDRLAFK